MKDLSFIWEWSDWLESDPESYALNGNVRSGLEFLLLLKAEKIELNDAPERKCELFEIDIQMCPPIVTLFGQGKSVTEGKRHYSHAYLL